MWTWRQGQRGDDRSQGGRGAWRWVTIGSFRPVAQLVRRRLLGARASSAMALHRETETESDVTGGGRETEEEKDEMGAGNRGRSALDGGARRWRELRGWCCLRRACGKLRAAMACLLLLDQEREREVRKERAQGRKRKRAGAAMVLLMVVAAPAGSLRWKHRRGGGPRAAGLEEVEERGGGCGRWFGSGDIS